MIVRYYQWNILGACLGSWYITLLALYIGSNTTVRLYESISILIIIYLLHNYFILIKICCDNISIDVSLIQYIFYMKNTFYIAPYVLSHAERSHFIRNSDHIVSYYDDVCSITYKDSCIIFVVKYLCFRLWFVCFCE